MSTVEVWDTLELKKSEYDDEIKHQAAFLDERTTAGQSELQFKNYTYSPAGVPQQRNCYDCGVYVCRSMEFPDQVMNFKTEKWDSEHQRLDLALRILKAPENALLEDLKGECLINMKQIWSRNERNK